MSPSVASHLKALGPSLAKQRALCADDRCSQQRALRPHLAEHLAKPPAAGGGQALRSGFKDGPRRSSHVRRAQEGGRGREDAAGSRPGAGRQVRVLARRVSPVTREMPAARQGAVSESTPRGPPARVAGRGAGVRQKGGSRAGKGVEGGETGLGTPGDRQASGETSLSHTPSVQVSARVRLVSKVLRRKIGRRRETGQCDGGEEEAGGKRRGWGEQGGGQRGRGAGGRGPRPRAVQALIRSEPGTGEPRVPAAFLKASHPLLRAVLGLPPAWVSSGLPLPGCPQHPRPAARRCHRAARGSVFRSGPEAAGGGAGL